LYLPIALTLGCRSSICTQAYAGVLSSPLLVVPPYTKGKIQRDCPKFDLLIHDSLSGEFPFTKEENVELMPFLKKMVQSHDGGFFFFENARTVSGDTSHAVPAIVSGCLPLNKNGKNTSHSTNMATQAKMRGYQTLSFSSRILNLKKTKWFMVENAVSVNFDQIWHPHITREWTCAK
jgi:hypothetical protein